MKRKYPERLVPEQISISTEYMGRESARWGADVEGWVLSYLRRNKIPSEREERGGEKYLRILFPSRWRAKFFVLMGNRAFPYFEFV